MPWKKVEYTVETLAKHLGATIKFADTEHQGWSQRKIVGISSIEESSPDTISFCRKMPKFEPNCGALLCDEAVAERLAKQFPCIVVSDPIRALVDNCPLFFEYDAVNPGIHSTAVIDSSAKIAATALIGPLCVIGANVEIGENTTLHSHVSVYPRVKIASNVTIHAGAIIREDTELGAGVILQPGAVIGGDGFGYIPDSQLGLRAVPQIGSVKLHERVEVGANSCVDRATLGKTEIGIGTKLDNLVQVGHNVQIGTYSLLCGQVGVGGSANIGNQVVLGGNSGVADHVNVVDKVRIAAKSGAISDISEPGDYGGYPAVPAREWRRMVAALVRLPDRLRKLQGKTKHEE